MSKMELLQQIGYNSEQVDLVCNRTDLDFRPIQQGIDEVTGKAVYQNCQPEDDIIAQQLYYSRLTKTEIEGHSWIYDYKPTNTRPVRKGMLIQDLKHGGRWLVSRNYQLITHQFMVRLAHTCADMLDIDITQIEQPAMRGQFYTKNQDGATISRDGNKLFVSYVTSTKYDLNNGGTPDYIQVGFTIINSLDGSGACYIVPFTIRLNCMNQMAHVMGDVRKHTMIKTSAQQDELLVTAKLAWENTPQLQIQYPKFEDFRLKLHDGRFIHNKKHEEQSMADTMAVAIQYGIGYKDDMVKMQTIPLTQEFVEHVVDTLSAGGAKLCKELSCIEVKREKDSKGVMQNIVRIVSPSATRWTLFCDITKIMHTYPVSNGITGHISKHQKVQSLFFGKQQQVVIA